MCVCVGGGGGHLISHLGQIFFLCYAFERMHTSRMSQTERTGGRGGGIFFSSFSFPFVSCTIWWVILFFNTKTVATEYSYSYFSVVTPSLGCLTLTFFDRGSL